MTFFKKLVSNSLPQGKNVRSNVTEILHPWKLFMVTGTKKIQKSLPPGQQDNLNALSRAKAIGQSPARLPPSNSLIIYYSWFPPVVEPACINTILRHYAHFWIFWRESFGAHKKRLAARGLQARKIASPAFCCFL